MKTSFWANLQEEFKSKLIYFGPVANGGSKDYIVYSPKNTLYTGMKKIENVYGVTCFFFNDELYAISIEYNNSYMPSWEEFLQNTINKYGNGVKADGGLLG